MPFSQIGPVWHNRTPRQPNLSPVKTDVLRARGFDLAALSFGDHTDSAWLFDITKPSPDPGDALPAAQVDADSSPARTEGIAAECSQAIDTQPAERKEVEGVGPPTGRQQEMTQHPTVGKDVGAYMQALSRSTDAGGGGDFDDEDDASQGALHPLLAAVPVVAPESVASEPEVSMKAHSRGRAGTLVFPYD